MFVFFFWVYFAKKCWWRKFAQLDFRCLSLVNNNSNKSNVWTPLTTHTMRLLGWQSRCIFQSCLRGPKLCIWLQSGCWRCLNLTLQTDWEQWPPFVWAEILSFSWLFTFLQEGVYLGHCSFACGHSSQRIEISCNSYMEILTLQHKCC